MLKKILIVDDERELADMISELLQALGYETRTLTSVESFLNDVKAWKPDLITMDLIMPEFSGLELLSILKNDEETKPIPVLIISAVGESVPILRDVMRQCNGVLTKPLSMKKLQECLDSIQMAA